MTRRLMEGFQGSSAMSVHGSTSSPRQSSSSSRPHRGTWTSKSEGETFIVTPRLMEGSSTASIDRSSSPSPLRSSSSRHPPRNIWTSIVLFTVLLLAIVTTPDTVSGDAITVEKSGINLRVPMNDDSSVKMTYRAVKYDDSYIVVDVTLVHLGVSWLALGIGTQMIGSYSIVGLDTTVNPGYPGVGFYSMVSNYKEDVKVAAPLEQVGFIATSFTVEGGVSTFQFTYNSSIPGAVAFPLAAQDGKSLNASLMIAHAQNRPQFEEHLAWGFLPDFDFNPSTPPYNLPATLAGRDLSSILFWHIVFGLGAFVLWFPLGLAAALLRRKRDRMSQEEGKSRLETLSHTLNQSWFDLHYVFQFLGGASCMLAVWLGIIFQDDRDISHFRDPHQYLGLFVWIAVIFQFVLAWNRPHLVEESYSTLPTQDGRKWYQRAWVFLSQHARVIWLHSHRLLGCFIYLGGLVNCFLGVDEVTVYVGDGSWTTRFDSGGPVFQISYLGAALTALLVISAVAVGMVVCWSGLVRWRSGRGGNVGDGSTRRAGSDEGAEMVEMT